jgi:hypothetical protein
LSQRRPKGRFFYAEFRNAPMQYHRHILLAAVAAIVWTTPAHAAAPEPDAELAVDIQPVATWVTVEARNHADGTTGAAAVLLGVARERAANWQAILRADAFGRATTVRIESAALVFHPGARNVAVTASLDGGSFRPVAWRVDTDGKGLELTDEAAVAFLTGLYGKRELQLAVVRPLSVPFVLTFVVAGAEQGLALVAKRGGWAAAPALSEAKH